MSQPASARPGKNIVICCDGTGNQFGPRNSNVVKLYTTLQVDNGQVAYYRPGVGTMGDPSARNWADRRWSVVKGLAFGAGFREAVLDAYRFLMNNYNDGDRVFLFGFSRGSYAVRALAGLLQGYGLLCRGNESHLPYAWAGFTRKVLHDKRNQRRSIVPEAAFKETFSQKVFHLHFVGLWDTVSSVGWMFTPLRLLDMAQNPLIRTARHALSIDERRCFFHDNLYGPALPGQDIVQVWFAGVHSDVGGSYPQPESALANVALAWMLGEARAAGLRVDEDRVRMVFGQRTEEPHAAAPLYATPAPLGQVHRSLQGPWWLLELLPHRYYDKDDEREQWRVPLGARRQLPAGAVVHPSVRQRMEAHGYRPPNLPADALTPLLEQPQGTAADLRGFDAYQPGKKPRTGGVSVGRAAAAAATLLAGVLLARRL